MNQCSEQVLRAEVSESEQMIMMVGVDENAGHTTEQIECDGIYLQNTCDENLCCNPAEFLESRFSFGDFVSRDEDGLRGMVQVFVRQNNDVMTLTAPTISSGISKSIKDDDPTCSPVYQKRGRFLVWPASLDNSIGKPRSSVRPLSAD